MLQLDIEEARVRFEELVDRAEAGETIGTMRSGRVVAWLMPWTADDEDMRDAVP